MTAGTTTLFDWCHNNATPAHTDAAIDALQEAGLRAVFGHGTVKPHPGNGDPAHKGEGSQGRGRGTIHGRGTLNNYDSAR